MRIKVRAISPRIPVIDRIGKATSISVSEQQAEMLIERHLVECRGSRRVTGLRLAPGIAVATVTAALRLGLKDRLPVAEDNRTVRRADMTGIVYEPHEKHVEAWDDGRPLRNTCGAENLIPVYEVA